MSYMSFDSIGKNTGNSPKDHLSPLPVTSPYLTHSNTNNNNNNNINNNNLGDWSGSSRKYPYMLILSRLDQIQFDNPYLLSLPLETQPNEH